MTNHNGTLVSNIFSPTKANHINMSELQWHSCRRKMLPKGQNHRKHCAHWHISLTFLYFLMSADDKSQWHTGFKHLQPNESKSHQYVRITTAQLQKEVGQNHRKHCAQWCISLFLLWFFMSADDKSQGHTGFKHLQPNESKSHQDVRITMAQLQQQDTFKRPKSQKTLRTVAHQSACSLFLMSGFEGFQSFSAQ